MKKETKPIIWELLIPIIIGIGLIIAGIFFIVENEIYKKHTTETEAIITHIEQYPGTDSDPTVYVAFSVNGVEYSGRLGSYGSSMKEGNSVKIRYKPDNPQNFRHNITSGGVVLMLLGGAFSTICIILYKRKLITDVEAALIQ